MNVTISNALTDQFNHRIYQESIPRILKVLDVLTDEQLWYTPNDRANSIGNLILHLCGNVTQWIGSGIGSRKDDRQRDVEFQKEQFFSKQQLEEKLWALREITDPVLSQLEDHHLTDSRSVQGFDETVLSILIHVIEHFSYHTGQIAIIAKYLTGNDLGFYKNIDLNITS